MKTISNRNNLSRLFIIISAFLITASLLLDVVRGKTFELGPTQWTGIILGIGFLAVSILLSQDSSHPAWQLSLFLLPMIPFYIYIVLYYMPLNLWFDEVYTLDHFVLRPLSDTLTDYHSTNNHIFFNIINNFYLRLCDISTLREAFEHSITIRLLMLLYTSGTAFFVYLTIKRYFNQVAAVISIIILATTIPFYNYAVQMRGYMLSMLLLSMLIYFIWQLEEKPRFAPAAAIFILTVLLLYTMPPNIYSVGGIFLFYLVSGLFQIINAEQAKPSGQKFVLSKQNLVEIFTQSAPLIVMAAITLAAIPVFLLYLPIFGQLMNNPNSYIGLFNFSILTPLTPAVLSAFLSRRWLLLLLMAAGMWYLVKTPKNLDRNLSAYRNRLIFLVSVLILPFLLAFVHGYIAFDRVFIVIVPLFAMSIAVLIDSFYHMLPQFSNKPLVFLAVLTLYCYGTFAFSLKERDEHVLADINQGKISQDLIYNVYQAHYEPQKILQFYINNYQLNTVPLFVYDWGDISAIPLYATYMDLAPQKIDTPSEFVSDNYREAHVITAYPNTFLTDIRQDAPDVQCDRLNPELSYINLFECTW